MPLNYLNISGKFANAPDPFPFGDEILVAIFLLLDNDDLSAASLVNRRWCNIVDDPIIWRYRLESILHKCDTLVKVMETTTIPNTQNNSNYKKEIDERLRFLAFTVKDIKHYMTNNSESMSVPQYINGSGLKIYTMTLGSLCTELKIGKQIIDGFSTKPMTQNFDLMELALRRTLGQLKSMFPRDKQIEFPSAIIEDPQAREHWERLYGKEVYYVMFDEFCKSTMRLLFTETETFYEWKDFLGYFINFPKDNIITTLKFHQITNIFGFENFSSVFTKHALGQGFVGLMSPIKAEELLANAPPKSYLVRFSRTSPDLLTVSCKSPQGQLQHSRNQRVGKDKVSLSEFLSSKFPDFRPLPIRVDADVLKLLDGKLTKMVGYSGNLVSGYMKV